MSILKERIRDRALELGFDALGFAAAERAAHADGFHAWLAAARHGNMQWLARNPERRCDPRLVLSGAHTLILAGFSYQVQDPPPALWNDPMRGRIARYAWGLDYHNQLEPKLKALCAWIGTETTPGANARYYVDTGPVLEREWAARAGLGFIGKNTLLIRPGLGSYLFLGAILTDIEIEPDPGAIDQGATLPAAAQPERARTGTCGACRRCLDACPTHAFPAAYILDSRLCISYLTIELRDAIPEPLRHKMGNWVYGCDECQSVCPWVRQYSPMREHAFLRADPEIMAPSLPDLMALDEDGFRRRFRGTPMKRTKRSGLLRNAAVALGNSKQKEAIPVLERATRDQDPLIREHAEWGLRQLKSQPRLPPA